MNIPIPMPLLAVVIAIMLPSPSLARDYCEADRLAATPPVVNFRIDNDLIGSGHQDQGYTNGAVLTLVSPDLHDYTGDPCLPRLARRLNSLVPALGDRSADQKNMLFSIGQSLYTPTDRRREDLVVDDRPYAAILMAGFGYNIRWRNTLHTTQLQLGVVGPLALGKEVQDAVHDAIGEDRFSGWDHQLRNEPLVGLVHERMTKRTRQSRDKSTFGWDSIGHYGGSIGNAFTHLNAGFEVRAGWNIPDDFGSTPIRPAGENTAPGASRSNRGVAGHAFLTVGARWVLRDITLDGNSFVSSHGVEKKEAVGAVGYGVVISYNRWKFALARYHRTREFDLQHEPSRFGSFTISRAL